MESGAGNTDSTNKSRNTSSPQPPWRTLLSVRARLAYLLLELRVRHGQVDADGNIVIDLPLSRQDLASLAGTRPESLSRVIKALEAAGVARFTGRRVVVVDLDVLVDEAERR